METETVLFIAGWVLFHTLIGALIGKLRGRLDSGLFWSFFLGPIGWIIVALMPDLRRKCPECECAVGTTARKCKHCGSRIDVLTVPTPQARSWAIGFAAIALLLSFFVLFFKAFRAF